MYAELISNYENIMIKNMMGNRPGKGGGKTLVMTLFLFLEWQHNMRNTVYSNIELDFDFKYLKGDDMASLSKKLSDSIIAIDELHEYADCRNSGSLQNKRVSTFFLQSRHTNSNVYYTTQFKDQVDKRIRRITDIDVICENLYIDSDGDGDDDLFKVTIQDRRRPDLKPRSFKIYGQPLFNMYDSTERINPFVWKGDKDTLDR